MERIVIDVRSGTVVLTMTVDDVTRMITNVALENHSNRVIMLVVTDGRDRQGLSRTIQPQTTMTLNQAGRSFLANRSLRQLFSEEARVATDEERLSNIEVEVRHL